MNKINILHFILWFSVAAFSQNSITVKGKIIDKNSKLPIESATVYFTAVKDSTIINYSITDKKGNFSFVMNKISRPLFFKISSVGFDDFKKELEDLKINTDFGISELSESPKNLKEVVIRREAPPIRIKKDTLEFNASSFKVLPDANVKTLLRQLPGVEIDAKGKITVNGQEVNNILVNGKPFFDKDGKIATENLPAEIIDKVQVSDTKTKEEQLSGESASAEKKTINLTIAKDKNKGLFGKFSAGKGSDNRYESSGLINYFKDKQKISVIGSSNNINATGFSMDEIFDSMGGGRNVYSSGDGSFNIDGQQFGGGNGITQSNLIGLNYADELFKDKFKPSMNYFFNNSLNNNENRSKTENLLPNFKTFTESLNIARRVVNAHNLNLELQYKLDSLTSFEYSPRIKKSDARNTSTRIKSTTDASNDLLNDSQSYSDNNSRNNGFESELLFFKKMKKKGRYYNIGFENNNTQEESQLLNISQTNFYKNNTLSDIRNQTEKIQNSSDSYKTTLRYSEPITDSLSVSIAATYDFNNTINDRNTFDFNPLTSNYTLKNNLLSNYITSNTNKFNPSVGLNINRKLFGFRFNLGTDVLNFNAFSDYLNVQTTLKKNYIFPNVNGYFNLKFKNSKSKSAYMNYNFKMNIPTANQLLPVENLSNPLNTIVGNPNLSPTQNYSFYLGFNDYKWQEKSGYYLYSGGNIYNNQIVSSTVFDSNFKSITTFQNINFTYDFYLGFEYNKSIKKEKHTFKYGLGFSSDFDLSKGFTNNALYESQGYSISPRLQLGYEYDTFFTFNPSYSYSFSKNVFENYIIDNASNFVHNFKIENTVRWPKNLVFGNDFGYTYNSNISEGFKKDFYLWNMSLGYNFFKEKLLAKVKVYDLLDQNINTTRTITPTTIQDSENTVLQRYIMFSLTYKFEKFGGKKKSEWDMD